MSFRSQALRDLVVERLAVAADEIFALFERTFAEYEEEFLQSKLLETRTEELSKEDCPDVQSLSEQTDVDSGLEHIKYEEREIPVEVRVPSASLKCEEKTNKYTFLQQEPVLEPGPDPDGERSDREEPGCSLDLNMKGFGPCGYSDTDDSEDWESSAKRATSDGQTNTCFQINSGRESLTWNNPLEFSGKTVSFPREQLPLFSHSEVKDKPFSCSVCNKSFPQKRILTAHMRIHTGEKPYHCKPCGLSFRFQQNYFQHDLAVHRKEKPFRCRVCKKDFVDKVEMIAHRNSHNTKSFSCSKCGKDFNCVRYLRRHLERCPRKKRHQDKDLHTSLSSQSAAQPEGPRFESRILLNTDVNDWL